jgi:hypothetical protein
VCRSPQQPLLNAQNKPTTCSNGQQLTPTVCGNTARCEAETGFCCKCNKQQSKLTKTVIIVPALFAQCTPTIGCSTPNAHCKCDTANVCKCDCTSELGFEISDNGRECKRARAYIESNVEPSCNVQVVDWQKRAPSMRSVVLHFQNVSVNDVDAVLASYPIQMADVFLIVIYFIRVIFAITFHCCSVSM